MLIADTVIRAFSPDHVIRLTGLSKAQLRYWDETGFFRPRYAAEDRRSPFSRIYSFKDIVGLRVLGVLRRQHKVPLQNLRKVAHELNAYTDTPWSDIVLYVFGKEVHFREPDTDKLRGIVSRQYVNIPLKSIMEDVSSESNKLRERSANQFGQIERHRFIAHNAWVIAGTRIPVNTICRFRDAGYSINRIIAEYPALTASDVRAAFEYQKKLAKAA